MLRAFHSLDLKVDHSFDIFGGIKYYETLWGDTRSIYRDYEKTKENVFSLKSIIDSYEKDWCLAHIDAVPDNFLFVAKDGKEEIRLIDWEYAGMQDPHVDIAMFCIYSLYQKDEVDRLIDLYFENNCKKEVRIKIYCYIAACGTQMDNAGSGRRRLPIGIHMSHHVVADFLFSLFHTVIIDIFDMFL